MPMRIDEIPDQVAAFPSREEEKAPTMSMRLDDLNSTLGEQVSQKDFDFSTLSFTTEEANAIKAKGKIGYFEQSIRMKKMEKVPILGLPVAVYEAASIKQAFNRLQKDEYGKDNELRGRDIETARKAIRYAGEEQLRGFSWGGGFIEGVSNLPAYMIEFALSSLVAAPGSATAVRMTGKVLAKQVASKALRKALVGTAALGTRTAIRTATVFAPRVVTGTYQNEIKLNLQPTEKGLQLNKQMQSKPFTSFAKALGDTAIEVFFEELGGFVINPALNKMAGAPIIKQVGQKMTALYKRLHPNNAIGKLFTKAGWDGFVAEVGEEILGDQLRAIFNVRDFGSQGNTLDRMIAAIPDGDEMAVMMGVLAVPGAANVTLQNGMAALQDYREKKRVAGQEVKAPKTLAGKVREQGFDPIEATIAEATGPLPQVELTEEEIEQLKVKRREGGIEFEESKPVPDRKIVDEITASQEFKEADRDRQIQLLIQGRTAELDRQRTTIEKQMTTLEKDVKKLSASKEKTSVKLVKSKQAELDLLSKELLSVHAQISDVVDSSAEELSREKLVLPGESLESLRGQARKVGARIERSRVENVFRNKKAQAEERRTALVKYLQARLPGAENAKLREKFSLRAAKDMTEAKLQKFFVEIEKLRDTVRAKQLRERAKSILGKMSSKIVSGVKKGVFANANIQALADEVIRVANLSAPAAEEELRKVHNQVVQLIELGEGESDVAQDLKFKAGLLSTISGLEARNADELEVAIQTLSKQLAGFQTGRDTVRELRKAQRQAEQTEAVKNITGSEWTPTNMIAKGLKAIGAQIGKLYYFSSFNLETFWRDLDMDKMVADPLFKVSEFNSALQQRMDRPVRQALFDIYGVSKTSTKDYMRFLTDRMSLDSVDPQTGAYTATIVLNNGETKDFKLSRMDVLYWYASAYQDIDIQDPEAYETLTGENELQAIREQVELEKPKDIEGTIAERAAKIRGNAIPEVTLEDMFSTLTEQDRRFAMEMRKTFTSFWPLINPVYARATGVNLTQVESYIPRIKKTASVKTVEDMFTQYALVEGHVTPFPGSTKERRTTSTAPFAQIGMMDVFMGFRDTMSHWLATHDITVRQQRYLKNREIRDSINAATDGVQNKTTGQWRDGMFVKLMDFHLKGMASRGRTDQSIRIPGMDFMRRNLSRYYLTKLKQFPLQVTSAFTAIKIVGHVDFLKGLSSFIRDPVGASKVLNQALSMHNRYQNLTPELKELNNAVQDMKNNTAGKAWRLFDKYAFIFVKGGNKAGVLIGGWSVFKSVHDRTGSTEEAFKAFDSFVLGTQQSALREQQTAATVGPARYFFQFVSAVGQYGRIYYSSWSNLMKKQSPENIKQWARTMVVFHAYIPVARWMLAQIGLSAPDDEEEEEKRKKQLLAYMISGPFSGLWLLADMANLATNIIVGEKGFDTGPAVSSQLNKTRNTLASAIRKAMDDDSEPDEVFQSMLKAGKEFSGLALGVPGPASDTIRALFQSAAGEDSSGHLLTPEDYFGIGYGQSIDMINYSKGAF